MNERVSWEDALRIHEAIHSKQVQLIDVEGESCSTFLNSSKLWACRIKGMEFVEQNPKRTTDHAARARNGHKLTWILPGWGLIDDGRLLKKHRKITPPLTTESPIQPSKPLRSSNSSSSTSSSSPPSSSSSSPALTRASPSVSVTSSFFSKPASSPSTSASRPSSSGASFSKASSLISVSKPSSSPSIVSSKFSSATSTSKPSLSPSTPLSKPTLSPTASSKPTLSPPISVPKPSLSTSTSPSTVTHGSFIIPITPATTCRYGLMCYRKNLQHFRDEDHPPEHPMVKELMKLAGAASTSASLTSTSVSSFVPRSTSIIHAKRDEDNNDEGEDTRETKRHKKERGKEKEIPEIQRHREKHTKRSGKAEEREHLDEDGDDEDRKRVDTNGNMKKRVKARNVYDDDEDDGDDDENEDLSKRVHQKQHQKKYHVSMYHSENKNRVKNRGDNKHRHEKINYEENSSAPAYKSDNGDEDDGGETEEDIERRRSPKTNGDHHIDNNGRNIGNMNRNDSVGPPPPYSPSPTVELVPASFQLAPTRSSLSSSSSSSSSAAAATAPKSIIAQTSPPSSSLPPSLSQKESFYSQGDGQNDNHTNHSDMYDPSASISFESVVDLGWKGEVQAGSGGEGEAAGAGAGAGAGGRRGESGSENHDGTGQWGSAPTSKAPKLVLVDDDSDLDEGDEDGEENGNGNEKYELAPVVNNVAGPEPGGGGVSKGESHTVVLPDLPAPDQNNDKNEQNNRALLLNAEAQARLDALRTRPRKAPKPDTPSQTIVRRSVLSVWELNSDELELQERLGGGAFGDVRKAFWNKTAVAVKTLHRTDDKARLMFLREASLLCRLQHPNVVRVFGIVLHHEKECMVMEYLPRTLKQAIKSYAPKSTPGGNGGGGGGGGGLPLDQLIKYAIDICKGIFYLHHHKPPIIHRDLKPANILVDEYNTCKLADFGISRDRMDSSIMTSCGTAQYMSPEVLSAAKYTSKVDIYSFGMMLYEMWTGVVPFSNMGRNSASLLPMQIIVKTVVERARPPLAGDHPIPNLIRACWADSPDQRPTIDEILHRLEALAAPPLVPATSLGSNLVELNGKPTTPFAISLDPTVADLVANKQSR